MGLYRRGSRYWFKKTIEGVTYRRPLGLSIKNYALVSGRAVQVENEIIALHYGLDQAPSKRITLQAYIPDYLKARAYKKSISRDIQRARIISDVIGSVYLHLLTRKHLARLEDTLLKQREISTSTLNRYFELLRSILNMAIEDDYIKENVVSKYYKWHVEDNERRSLSLDELDQVFEASRILQSNPTNVVQAIIYDLVRLAFLTGMRLSEILFLQKEYLRDGFILYPVSHTKSRRRTGTLKKARAKTVILCREATAIIDKQKSNGPYVFPTGKRRDSHMITRTIDKIKHMTEIHDFSFHLLRHTFSTMISSRHSLSDAKVLLGHSDIKTTIRYSHGNGLDDMKRKVNDLIENVGKENTHLCTHFQAQSKN